MRLTPEQQAQVRQAKERSERRVTVSFTPEQRRDWQAAVEQELAGKEEDIAHFRKLKAAAEASGFLGDIRRTLLLSRRSTDELAQAMGVDREQLERFRTAEADLPVAVLERLIESLGLRLVQEIPR